MRIQVFFILSKTKVLGGARRAFAAAIPQLTVESLPYPSCSQTISNQGAQGIYPTAIIVLVCLQRSQCDTQFTYDTECGPAVAASSYQSMIFARGVSRSRTAVSHTNEFGSDSTHM